MDRHVVRTVVWSLALLGLSAFAAAQDTCLVGNWAYESGYEQIFATTMGAGAVPIEFSEVEGVQRITFTASGEMTVQFEAFGFGIVMAGPPAIEVLTVMNGVSSGSYSAADGVLDSEVADGQNGVVIEQQVLLDGQPFAMPALPFDTIDPVGPQESVMNAYSCDGDTMNFMVELPTPDGGNALVPMVYRRLR